jgi:8-oxo-dGTP pyrophosphatase MutT (NUDIX family)
MLRNTYADLQRQFADKPWRSAANLYRAPMTDILQELIDREHVVLPSIVRNGWIELDTRADCEVAAALERGEHAWLVNRDRLAGRPVVSAGGLPIRQGARGRETLLVGSGETGSWRIPKGMVQMGESLEAAAIREVAEETGYLCQIRAHLGTARWPYYYENQLYEELVHFFAMEPTRELTRRDREHAAVRWHHLESSATALLYENERVIARAAAMLEG